MRRRFTFTAGRALAAGLALGGCVSMPPEIKEVFAPPTPSENSHFRPVGTVVSGAGPVCESPVATAAPVATAVPAATAAPGVPVVPEAATAAPAVSGAPAAPAVSGAATSAPAGAPSVSGGVP